MVMKNYFAGFMWMVSGIVIVSLAMTENAFAHCDTLDGPVVQTARVALEKGDVTPVLKWVQADDETEIRESFQKALAVRTKGREAKALADRYFFETLVRIHRAGEGAPYTGLKPGKAVDPAIALADKALISGSVEELVGALTKAMQSGVRERFQSARNTRKHAEDSVVKGHDFVEAYVSFTHYVEGLHFMINSADGHHRANSKPHSGHN